MIPRVAIVKTDQGVPEAYQEALTLIGGIDDLNKENKDVTIKIGIYDRRNLNYPTIQVVNAVANAFTLSKRIRIAESNNHHGIAIDRLHMWNDVFTNRVRPFNLSEDSKTCEASVCGEPVPFSHILFKPNVLVSLHVLRQGKAGSIFKNLLGLIPDTKKERFHDQLGVALIDIAEAVGWIDLAVIDGTYIYKGAWKEGKPLARERANFLIVGRDPVAVETVGSFFMGEEPLSISSIAIATERKLGESNISKIHVLGESLPSKS